MLDGGEKYLLDVADMGTKNGTNIGIWSNTDCDAQIYRIYQEPGRLWKRYAYGLVKFSWLSFRILIGGFR